MIHNECAEKGIPCTAACAPAFGLGDIVSLGWNDGYDNATVSKLNEDGTVNLFRPYTHTNDFSYTGGVICYVGVETVKHVNPNRLRLICKGRELK